MINEKTKIGKDVIESLTLAMYDDPKCIYREYIQNSADQIDIAFEQRLTESKNDCQIEIEIDQGKRTITISDNATGVQEKKVLSVLKNMAQGVKDRTKHKGFRGIGRLGGLACCDRLIFETSYKGEEVKSVLSWNAKELKQIINDRTKKEDAATVIDTITSLQTDYEQKEKKYFRVILENVSNDNLFNKEEIYNYLSMVAPVPYKKGFFFDKKIYQKAQEFGQTIDEYNLYLNNEQIFKQYTTSIYEGDNHNKKRIDEITDIKFFDIRNKEDQLLCWGWYSISNFAKQIPSVNIAKGIRLRKGNIQIGGEKQLVKFFKEPRGLLYFFGEVHAVSPELIPNARRDYFTENEIFKLFEKELKIRFEELYEFYYFSSQIRSEKKKILQLVSFKKEYQQKVEKGFTKPEDKDEYEEKFNKIKEEAKKAKEKIEKLKTKVSNNQTKTNMVEKIISEIKDNVIEKPEIEKISNNRPKLLTDNLHKINRKDKKLVGKILAIIDNILPKDTAEMVKQKIIEELNK